MCAFLRSGDFGGSELDWQIATLPPEVDFVIAVLYVSTEGDLFCTLSCFGRILEEEDPYPPWYCNLTQVGIEIGIQCQHCH